MSYLKQKDSYSCGAIAIANALKWAGAKITYKDLPKIKKMLVCRPYDGTSWTALHSVIISDFFKKYAKGVLLSGPKKKDIDKHLLNGGGAIIVYVYPTKKFLSDQVVARYHSDGLKLLGHVFFIEKRIGRGYIVCNEYDTSVDKTSMNDEYFLRENWKKYKDDEAPNQDSRIIWLLTRKK